MEAEDSAYYFRYLARAIEDQDLVSSLLAHEVELIAAGVIVPLGRRFVARRHPR